MRRGILFAVCAAACIARVWGGAEGGEGGADENTEMPVLDLGNDDDFEALTSEGFVLVEFYVSWCPHCKKSAPEFIKAAQTLKGEAKLIGVNGEQHSLLKAQYNVHGYPAFMAFIDGAKEPVKYDGGRSEVELVRWVRLMQGDAVVEVDDEDDVDALVDRHYSVVCGFFPNADHRQAKRFRRMAKEMRNTTKFAVSYDADFAEGQGVAQPGIVMYQRFDTGQVAMDPYDATKVEAFIEENRYPLFDQLSIVNYHGYLARGYPLVYLFVESFGYEREDKDLKALYATMKALATEYKGKLSFLALDQDGFQHFMDEMSLETKFPNFAISEDNKKAFPMPQGEPLTPESLRQHLQSYLDGRLIGIDTVEKATQTKDEDVGAHDNLVVELTTENLKAVAFDKTKDVFLKFFAPWCGHCKRMAPAWKKLAQEYKDNDSVVVAEFNADGHARQIPRKFDVKGYPTIYWVNKKNQAVKYTNDRDFPSFKEFVEKNIGKKL